MSDHPAGSHFLADSLNPRKTTFLVQFGHNLRDGDRLWQSAAIGLKRMDRRHAYQVQM